MSHFSCWRDSRRNMRLSRAKVARVCARVCKCACVYHRVIVMDTQQACSRTRTQAKRTCAYTHTTRAHAHTRREDDGVTPQFVACTRENKARLTAFWTGTNTRRWMLQSGCWAMAQACCTAPVVTCRCTRTAGQRQPCNLSFPPRRILPYVYLQRSLHSRLRCGTIADCVAFLLVAAMYMYRLVLS